MKKPTGRAAIYCRISRDPEGTRDGVDRQEEDCRKLARKLGLVVAGVYTDNDISASSFSRKTRPEYTVMLEAARRGDVDVILAYSNSRLTRRLLELEDLIQLHEATGVQIKTVVSGQDDLSTADGRMVARIKASVDSAESDRMGERLRRKFLERAMEGKTNHGGRPFGWAADKLAIDEREAALIRDAARDVIDGVPLRVLAQQWNDAGVTTSRGGAWSHTTLRRLLQRPRLAGWRTHDPAVRRGEQPNTRHTSATIVTDATGAPVRGEWEPILDQETFDAVQAVFARDGRGGGRRGSRQYVLTGLLRCGTCGGRMHGTNTRSKAGYAYSCSGEPFTHSVTITGPATEEAVMAVLRARLETAELPTPDAPAAVVAGSGDEDRAGQITQQIGELMAAYRAGQLSAGIVFPQVQELEAERADLAAERARDADRRARPRVPDVEDIDRLDAAHLRAVLETVFDTIVVRPAAHRGEPFNADRLTYVWRKG